MEGVRRVGGWTSAGCEDLCEFFLGRGDLGWLVFWCWLDVFLVGWMAE